MSPDGLRGGGHKVPRKRGNSSKPNCPVTPVEGHPSQDGRLEGPLGETLMSPYGLRGGGHKVPRTRGYFSKPNSPVMAVRPDGRLACRSGRAVGLGGGGHKVPRVGLLFSKPSSPEMAVRPDGRLASWPERAAGLGGGGHKVPRMGLLLFPSRVAPRWPSARTVGLLLCPKGPLAWAGEAIRSPAWGYYFQAE